MKDGTTVDLGEKVQGWLTKEGFTIEPVNDPNLSSVFKIYKSENPDNKWSVFQAKNDDKIVIQSGIKLGEEEIQQLSRLTQHDIKIMVEDLLWVLNTRPTLFNVGRQDGIPSEVTISNLVYSDGLTKDRIMNAISEMYKTQALVLLRLNRYMEKVNVNTTSSPQQQAGTDSKKAEPASSTCPSCGTPISDKRQKFCGKCGTPQN